MDVFGLDGISASFYKIYSPLKIATLVLSNDALQAVLQFPLINTNLLETQFNHGGTLSISLSSACLNSLNITSLNRTNKN